MFEKLDTVVEKYHELTEKVADPDVIANQEVWRKHMKEMGEIERFGTGVKRVCDMFIDYGLPKPEWLLTADGLVVKVFACTVTIVCRVPQKSTSLP